MDHIVKKRYLNSRATDWSVFETEFKRLCKGNFQKIKDREGDM